MDKFLQLIIEDFDNHHKPSAECQLALRKVCDAEKIFMDLLNDEQKKEYLKFNFVQGKYSIVEQNEFAVFLFENLKSFLSAGVEHRSGT